MLFNSFEFFLFLPTVFVLYWFVFNKNSKLQNLLVLTASYFFYGYWDWRFLSLIIFSSIIDYTIGLKIGQSSDRKYQKKLLFLSLFINLGSLLFFKYYNFFIDSFIDAFSFFGTTLNIQTLNIIIPIGISFYTFQTLSYSIDVYKKKIEPTKDIISFLAFVSFFPQLVAGPIERAADLLPQFLKNRKFDYDKAIDGMRQILWGLFKKVVIADSLAHSVNDIFQNYETYSGTTLLIGGLYFTIQIYADFSGYSDIAIGTARLFGFNLKQNFAYPLFSTNITELWRRWHISLSTWFRDYLFQPLAFTLRDYGAKATLFALLVTFTTIGFWHGANWTFIIFGFLHALALIYEVLTKKIRKKVKKKYNYLLYNGISMLLTFSFWCFTCILFRSENLTHFFNYISHMLNNIDLSFPAFVKAKLWLNILILFLVDWYQKNEQHGLSLNKIKIPSPIRWGIYFGLTTAVAREMAINLEESFIYFQF